MRDELTTSTPAFSVMTSESILELFIVKKVIQNRPNKSVVKLQPELGSESHILAIYLSFQPISLSPGIQYICLNGYITEYTWHLGALVTKMRIVGLSVFKGLGT